MPHTPTYADPIWNAAARLHGGSPSGTTEIATANHCLQHHGFRYDLGLRLLHRPIAADARERGTLLHIAWAHRYAARIPNFSRFVTKDPYDAMREAAQQLQLGYLLDRSFSAYKVYNDFHGDNDPFDPVDVETPCEMSVIDSDGTTHRVTTLIDLQAVHKPTGLLLDINHKARGRVQKLSQTASTDPQFLLELALARTRWPATAALAVNPFQLPASGPPKAFPPEMVPLSPHAYARIASDVAEVKRRINATRRSHPNPLDRPRSWACNHFGTCE